MTTLTIEPSPTADSASGYAEVLRLMSAIDGDEKHEPAASSTLDVLWVLYDRILRIDPSRPDDPERDRFVLSKGHGPQALYAVLAQKGFIPEHWLADFGSFTSPLGHHPDRRLVPGIEISSGSLGHGLPIAVGMALALRARGLERSRVFCLLGDGELDEGSNHEALAIAGRLRLGGLTAVVVDNSSSTHGWRGGIARRFGVEGWASSTVDGRSHADLEAALSQSPGKRPRVVVAVVEEDVA